MRSELSGWYPVAAGWGSALAVGATVSATERTPLESDRLYEATIKARWMI